MLRREEPEGAPSKSNLKFISYLHNNVRNKREKSLSRSYF